MAQNPELSPQIMYNYDKGSNIPWTISEYKTPRQYLDPVMQVKQRQYEKQKKGQKDKRYLTKKGFYMDYHIKIGKSIPGSNAHNFQNPWPVQEIKNLPAFKSRKVDSKLIKETYLDQIQNEQKRRKKPGVGAYSLQKPLKQKLAALEELKKKKHSVGQKIFYYQNTESISNDIPGAGNYSPHDEISKIRKNKTTYKQWIKKHSAEKERSDKKCKSRPDPATYRPLNSTFTTFDMIEKQKTKKAGKVKHFGKDSRFQYTRPDLKKIKQKRPDPISYNTLYEWRGKSKSPKHKPLNELVAKHYQTLSVYH